MYCMRRGHFGQFSGSAAGSVVVVTVGWLSSMRANAPTHQERPVGMRAQVHAGERCLG